MLKKWQKGKLGSGCVVKKGTTKNVWKVGKNVN